MACSANIEMHRVWTALVDEASTSLFNQTVHSWLDWDRMARGRVISNACSSVVMCKVNVSSAQAGMLRSFVEQPRSDIELQWSIAVMSKTAWAFYFGGIRDSDQSYLSLLSPLQIFYPWSHFVSYSSCIALPVMPLPCSYCHQEMHTIHVIMHVSEDCLET